MMDMMNMMNIMNIMKFFNINNMPNNNQQKPGINLTRNRCNMPNDIGIGFILNQGQLYNIVANPYEKIGDVIVEFMNLLNVNMNFNQMSSHQIMFSFNSKNLAFHKNKTLIELGIVNNSKIAVIDMNNILGGIYYR